MTSEPIYLPDEENFILSEYCRHNCTTRGAVVAEYVRSLAESLQELPKGWRYRFNDFSNTKVIEGDYRGYWVRIDSIQDGFTGTAYNLQITNDLTNCPPSVSTWINEQNSVNAVAKMQSLIDNELE